jgi:signal transduction histidine kinase
MLRSVRFRLTAGVTLLCLLCLLGTSWLLVSQVRSQTTAAMKRQSAAEARSLASRLETSGGAVGIATTVPGSSILPGATSSGTLPAGESGTGFSLVSGDGDVVAQSSAQATAASQTVVVEAHARAGTIVQAVPVTIDGQAFQLVASSPMEPVNAAIAALARSLAVAGPLLVLGVALLTWLTLGRAFRPVEAIIARSDEISAHTLDERVPVPPSGDEVARLAGTMNRMLARLQASSESQRRFVSDASHELRSPVAASRAQLEVALGHPHDADWTATARTVLDEQERLSRLVDDLLLIARLDEGGEPSRVEVDLDDVVFEEASRAHRVGVDVSQVTPVRVSGDLGLLQRLVRNLVDNAVRHAGNRVWVSLASGDGLALLAVEDDGAGVPPELRDSVFDRFTRLEDARGRDAGGAGLGLAVVREVARAHGGTARVVESALGGARFEVRIPLG